KLVVDIKSVRKDRQILPLDVTVEAQLIEERCETRIVSPKGYEETKAIGTARLLRPRRQRPRRRAAKPRAEPAPWHSLTSSARESRACGILRSIKRAVFMLTTNSSLVDCSIGNTLGLAPFRILST